MPDPTSPAPSAPPAAPAAPANQPAAPGVQPAADAPKADFVPVADFNSLKDGFFKFRREAGETIDALKAKLADAKPAAPAAPPGVEERIRAQEQEVANLKREIAERDRRTAVLKAAAEHNVAGDRLEFLEFKLQRLYPNLTADGVPDPNDPAKRMTVPFIVEALVKGPDGGAFRAAPNPTALPAGGKPSAPPGSELPEYTEEDMLKGRIPIEVRKAGAYRLKPRD